MKITITQATVQRWENRLTGPLRHFEKHIQQTLEANGFTTSFGEMNLHLVLDRQDTLAEVDLNRRYKTIAVRLQAPELAPDNNSLSPVQLAHTLIDTFSQAGQLISGQLKKNDHFDITNYSNTLTAIKASVTPALLEEISNTLEIKRQQAIIDQAEQDRESRKQKNLPKDTLIKDLRLYYAYQLPAPLLYLNRYVSLVLASLVQKELMCPGYHHLYISIGTTRSEALKKTHTIEDWHTFGIAVLPESTLLEAPPDEQQALVLKAIQDGLEDIATLDGLDRQKIDAAIAEARETGVLAETVFKAKENKKIAFVISTKVIPGRIEQEIFFTIVDKDTEKVARWKFGEEDPFIIGGWFGTITVTNKKIRIKPRAHMDLVLAGKPMELEFDVAKELAKF